MAKRQRNYTHVARSRTVLWVILFFAIAPSLVHAATPVSWKKGADFTKALAGITGFSWTDRPLREGLDSLEKEYGVPIWLDRHIDPTQRVEFRATDLPLETSLQGLAENLKLEMHIVGNVVFFHPAGYGSRFVGLSKLHRQYVDKLPTANKVKWQTTEAIVWEEATSPREIFDAELKKINAVCDNPNLIPHDLWSERTGPALSHVDLLTWVLFSCDLAFVLQNDGTLHLIPAPQEITYEETYTIVGDVLHIAKKIKAEIPTAKLQREGTNKIIVLADAAQHTLIRQTLLPQKTVIKKGEKLYSLSVKNETRGAILNTVAKDLQIKLQADAKVIEILKERVTFSVEKASLQELLQKVLDPPNLKSNITDTALEILPKE